MVQVVLDILHGRLDSGQGEDSLDSSIAWNILDLKLSLVGENVDGPVFGIGGDFSANNSGVSIGTFSWEAVVADVEWVSGLNSILEVVCVLFEVIRQVVPLKKIQQKYNC